MKQRLLGCVLVLTMLCGLLCGCGAKKQGSDYETAAGLIDSSVQELFDAIGEPLDSRYASSCLGEGEDGELYYDGFTVYTYRDSAGETIYDVMQARP